jgi:hypothetical protein
LNTPHFWSHVLDYFKAVWAHFWTQVSAGYELVVAIGHVPRGSHHALVDLRTRILRGLTCWRLVVFFTWYIHFCFRVCFKFKQFDLMRAFLS